MEVLIDERHKGFVHLADLSENYDKNDLYKFPVGKIVRVCIADNTKEPYKCTVQTDCIAATTNKNDTFSGIPNPDGHLDLMSYTNDPRRQIEFLELLYLKYEEKPAPKDEAYDYMIDCLKNKYNAKSVAKRGVVCIFTTLCRDNKNWKPFLEKKNDHFILTQCGLDEIGAKKTEEVLQKASETIEKVDSVFKNIPEEVEIKVAPIVEQQPQIHTERSETTIDEVITYIRYTQRLIDILRERVMLDKEIAELTAWKNNNKHLETAAQKFFQAVVKDGKNVLNDQ
jgi:hypothetical protein